MKIMPITAVLAYLAERHPALHAKAEIERKWVWLADTDLRGDQHKPVREALKEIGFQFKFSGDHVLPSGRGARWSHHCESPIPRRRKGWGKKGGASVRELSDEELLAAVG
jgi:hypothetical protein